MCLSVYNCVSCIQDCIFIVLAWHGNTESLFTLCIFLGQLACVYIQTTSRVCIHSVGGRSSVGMAISTKLRCIRTYCFPFFMHLFTIVEWQVNCLMSKWGMYVRRMGRDREVFWQVAWWLISSKVVASLVWNYTCCFVYWIEI